MEMLLLFNIKALSAFLNGLVLWIESIWSHTCKFSRISVNETDSPLATSLSNRCLARISTVAVTNSCNSPHPENRRNQKKSDPPSVG